MEIKRKSNCEDEGYILKDVLIRSKMSNLRYGKSRCDYCKSQTGFLCLSLEIQSGRIEYNHLDFRCRQNLFEKFE